MFRNERTGENGTNSKKSPEGWRFKLDAKRGPFEIGKFGKNGKLAQVVKNRQRAGDLQNVANIQINCQKWSLFNKNGKSEKNANKSKIC